jgi:hypothetical protein
MKDLKVNRKIYNKSDLAFISKFLKRHHDKIRCVSTVSETNKLSFEFLLFWFARLRQHSLYSSDSLFVQGIQKSKMRSKQNFVGKTNPFAGAWFEPLIESQNFLAGRMKSFLF